jgi:hypothetical protein
VVGADAGRDLRRVADGAALWAALALTPGLMPTSWACSAPTRRCAARWFNLLSEMIGTAVLVVVAGSIYSHGLPRMGRPMDVGQWLVASLVWGIGFRWVEPRATRSILRAIWARGWFTGCADSRQGPSNWGYAWIPLIGDMAGARWRGCCCGLRICRVSFSTGTGLSAVVSRFFARTMDQEWGTRSMSLDVDGKRGFPGLNRETWGTQCCGMVKDAGKCFATRCAR